MISRPAFCVSQVVTTWKEVSFNYPILLACRRLTKVPDDIADRFAWNQTIGPLTQRPGHAGAWGYYNTDGLGLDEYFHWCIDLDMEPVLGVFTGHSLDGEVVSEEDFQPWVDDVLNELEYVMGDTSTHYGALRAQYGNPEPYALHYVELGNEEELSGGQPYVPTVQEPV